MAAFHSAQQPFTHIPDELISLFSRNMSLSSEQQAAIINEQSQYAQRRLEIEQQLQHQQPPPPAQENAMTYSISQHYNHSSHIAKPTTQTDRRASLPEPGHMEAENILRNHGINPAVLTPSQLQLFRVGSEDQQRRLLELWSICPPSGAQNIASLAWSSTTVEQEEQLARARYEGIQQEPQQQTLQQTNDSRWLQNTADTEPYMATGYEQLAHETQANGEYTHFASAVNGPSIKRAMDPVYLGPDYIRQQQQLEMASQYGAFEHFRGAAPVDSMDVVM